MKNFQKKTEHQIVRNDFAHRSEGCSVGQHNIKNGHCRQQHSGHWEIIERAERTRTLSQGRSGCKKNGL